ncbi:UDP-N-acetylmuramoyl-tripeptide--D-alanyl-D-alanine ligase [Moraxella caviae]|uniref:UDP-N-acetylmuramoyl-tripeptide--D-alanyl-D-alanine ligase n=1 Tax=Moraxella caviae TaxID=34060 RepID=A0A1T0A1H2_9GAMM|nr:UDP-N-acetylmuramoyl-tripeptide--D-alanyl-D-alanine ligase [Moraxella caviae]OOR89593.1 UDP-N-acetylmuramoyl-tripeptide--D-alanyl-D-alanine ligase [Moraxella caviae]STZ10276.1 UDP-N-acetylmuramoyl-tripeptide--D-alanyl-D-alanine ligase [Moraxella caviae]VEW11252.1 UDP-N-acetylmuramoyl-tripeptide--D-alanyl-D-alanine ligase [Moraxella caviae]
MTPYLWTAKALSDATGGTWQGDVSTLSTTKITTDTRKIEQGDVFLAIKGDNFDAHDFVENAKQSGAAAIIVERAVAVDLPQLIVADTKLALGALGKYRRDAHPDLTVVALTGSSGKTTTKEMMGAILSQIAPTLITRGNLNNDLGVPMMLLELTDAHKFAVMELGANHLGEIAYTANLVRPDVACVLNIGTAHLGEFGGRANIARAKAEIYSALSADGVAVLPFGDEFFGVLQEEAAKFTERFITFGEQNVPLAAAELADEDVAMLAEQGVTSVLMMGDVFADDVDVQPAHSEFSLNVNLSVDDIDSVPVALPFVGEHNIANALAATAAMIALGVPVEQIAAGLQAAKPPQGRLTRLAFGEHLLIDDTYNANPTSMLAAAGVLEQAEHTKILVVGDIFELGAAADDEHRTLGEKLAGFGLDYVLTVGEHMAHTATAINAADSQTKPKATHFADKTALLAALKELLNQGASTVLFKGSRGMKMESLIADLQK